MDKYTYERYVAAWHAAGRFGEVKFSKEAWARETYLRRGVIISNLERQVDTTVDAVDDPAWGTW
jgi:hypothetical protein